MELSSEEIEAGKQSALEKHGYDMQQELAAEDREDWSSRCAYHKPSEAGIKAIESNRASVQALGLGWLESLPECDERDTALHYLQQALMWANAAAAYRIPGSEKEA